MARIPGPDVSQVSAYSRGMTQPIRITLGFPTRTRWQFLLVTISGRGPPLFHLTIYIRIAVPVFMPEINLDICVYTPTLMSSLCKTAFSSWCQH